MRRYMSGYFSIVLLLLITTAPFAQDIPQRDDFDYNLFETEFNWLEIEDVGTVLDELGDNDFQGPFPIGFRFPYYGRFYEEFWIGSNGFIGFGPSFGYSSALSHELPHERSPNNIIALLWKDLNPEAFWADGVIYRGMREGKLVIQFEGIAERNVNGIAPENTITMQLVLEPDGDIIFQYETIGDEFNLETGVIGVEGHDGEEGLTVLLDGDILVDDLEEIADRTAFMVSRTGHGMFLVWDAGANTFSGDAQERALVRLGNEVVHLSLSEEQALPEDLGDFDAVFVNLGNYGENGQHYHTLTEAEGEILTEYLEDGGSVYMEGSDTWHSDDVTDVHPYFNIRGVAGGGSLETPIRGWVGSLAAGMVFTNYQADDNNSVDHLVPINGAEGVFTFVEGDGAYFGMVSFQGESYHTIGCSFEYGALIDGNSGTKLELMSRIVSFLLSPPPNFYAPIDLTAEAADHEITLFWDIPRRDMQMQRRILELERDIANLLSAGNGEKPDRDTVERIYICRREIAEIEQQRNNAPRRDDLDGFNIYVDGEFYDFTNAHRFTVIELENGQEYQLSVTSVYTDPDGESDPAGPITVVPVGVLDAPFVEDFEDSNGGFYSIPADDAWEWGEPPFDAIDGDNVWGTLLEGNYPDLAEFNLNLPQVNLSDVDNAWLAFYHYMNCEGGWDGGRVEISTDNGMRWLPLQPRSGYNEESVFVFDGQAAFSGSTGGWEWVTFDLDEYIGETVRIRFSFKSDESNFRDYAGWFIDSLSIFEPEFGSVYIWVYDENPEAIPNANVRLGNIWSGRTNEIGRTPLIEDVPVGFYTIYTSAVGFISDTSDVDVEPGQINTHNIVLDPYNSDLHIEVEDIEPGSPLEVRLGFAENIEREAIISNRGFMETEYQIYINYFFEGGNPYTRPGFPQNGEVWDLIETYDLTAVTGEQYFTSAQFILDGTPAVYRLVAFAGDFNSGDCHLYHYYRDGEYIINQMILHNSLDGWGMRDLAYDGDNFLYGSADASILEYDLTNSRINRVIHPEVDLLAVNRAIAYVPEDDAFWIGDRDDSWYKISREDGEILDIVVDHGLTGVVGMAWNPADGDGACLYIHNLESEDGGGAIYRYNTENGELNRQLTTVAEDEGFPGGAFVTYLYDTHNYVLGVVVQEADRDIVKLYQLEPYDAWLTVDHSNGEIEVDAETPLTISFDAAGYIDIELEAAVEIHDQMSGQAVQLHCYLLIEGAAGSLEGTVTLEGEGEDDVTEVTLTTGDIEVHPDIEGEYHFDQLFPGEYIIEAYLEGYEGYISDPLEVGPDDIIEQDITLHPLEYGAIAGTVTSVYEEIIEGVEVIALLQDDDDLFAFDSTDEEGNYSITLPPGVYDVFARKTGWIADPVRDQEVVNDEVPEVNFEMDDRLNVSSIRADGYFDDRVNIYWLPAGSDGEFNTLTYDDGILANGVYLVNRNDIIASRFEPEGTYDILSLSIYILTRDDQDDFNLDRNTDNALFYKVFAEDPETGLPDPDGMIVDEYVDQHMGWFVDEGWTTIQIDDQRFLEGPFFFGWNRDPDRFRNSDYEVAGMDESFDNEGTCFIRIDNIWREYNDFPGDLMIRVVIWDYFEDRRRDLVIGQSRNLRAVNPLQLTAGRLSADELTDGIRLVYPSLPSFESYKNVRSTRFLSDKSVRPTWDVSDRNVRPTRRVTGDPFDWHEIYSGFSRPRRDLFLGYNIFVDNDLRDELIEETEWEHTVGSNHEDEEHTYRVEPVYEEGEAPRSAEVVAAANMPPGPPRYPWVENDGEDFTLYWSSPNQNADGTDCEDFAATEVYLSDRLVATVDAGRNEWSGSVDLGEEDWYNFRLITRDEVPNRSEPIEFSAPLGVAVVYNFERFGNDPFEVDPPDDAWQRSSSRTHGPHGAYSGSYYYGMAPRDGRYQDNIEWSITTVDEFRVEAETARLDLYHYISAEDGHDGGQLLISVDGGQWELFVPEEGYPDQTVAAFGNGPAFTGESLEWVPVSFDLSPYHNHTVRLKWLFASDQSISWYAGWYIDDVVLWSCSIVEHADLSGTVIDQDENSVADATVRTGMFSNMTDNEGNYILTGLPLGEHTVQASKPGYQSAEANVDVQAEDNQPLNLELYLPIVEVDPEGFEFTLNANEQLETEFNLFNHSEIALPYVIRLESTLGGMRDENESRTLRRVNASYPRRDDPWDVQFDYNLTEITDLRRFTGAEFANGNFYITAGDPERGAVIAVLNSEGRLLQIFPQPIEQVGWGMRDLAWDGEFLYGSQDREICVFNLFGELDNQFAGAPLDINRALAYDPEANGLWVTQWDEAWYLIDMEGNVQYEWFDHGLNGVYGFAYHPDDPDEMPLYALNLEEDGRTGIYRANPYNDEIEQVQIVDGEPGGCFITGGWDSNFWILGGIFNADDPHLTGLELSRREGWIQVDPLNAEIAADSQEEFTVTIAIPEDVDPDDEFSAEISVRAFGAEQISVIVSVDIEEGFRGFDNPEESDEFMTLHIESVTFRGGDLPICSEIAVFTPRDDVGGVVRWLGEAVDLIAYASQSGFRNDESFDFRIWDFESEEIFAAEAEFDQDPSTFQSEEDAYVRLIVDPPESHTVTLLRGWNLVSTYVDPFEPDITVLLREVNEAGQLVIIKDIEGDFWWPRFRYNGLGDWDVLQGYYIRVTEDTEFDAVGERIAPDTPIQLRAGWNMISYLFDNPVHSTIAWEGIADDLIIAKDGFGLFWVPQWNFNNLGNLSSGQGYKLNMSNNRELVYNQGDGRELIVPPNSGRQHLSLSTGSDMSLLITGVNTPFIAGDSEIIIYAGANNLPVGRAILDELPCGVIVRGDDETTDEIDGAVEGDLLTIVINNNNEENTARVQSSPRYFGMPSQIEGELCYFQDGFAVFQVELPNIQIPSDFVVNEAYPNPFNSHTVLQFGLPEASIVSIIIRDLNGRKIYTTPAVSYQEGWHSLEIDASRWASGIYLAEVNTPVKGIIRKLVLLR
ncbi:MAG: carboxypeptidase regulatory-like domain-containing protein [Candidatus Hatepunaea meridiana]|nr:carboxypeptidase regulatory-like domain-containing protein [Candidatus Hatepunaea meridiana]